MADQLKEKGITLVEKGKPVLPAASGPANVKKPKGQISVIRGNFNFVPPPKVPVVAKVVITAAEKEKARAERDEFIAQVNEAMVSAVGQLWAIHETGDLRSMYAAAEKELTDSITAMLSYEEPFRLFARLAYAEAFVSGCPERRGCVVEVMDRLIADGFLEEVPADEGTRIYGKSYKLAQDVRKEPRAVAVAKTIEVLVTKTVEAGRAYIQEGCERLKAEAGENSLTPADIVAGNDGRAVLTVPDKKLLDGRFFRGGFILVEVKDGNVRILDGIGGVERTVKELAEAEPAPFLAVSQLVNERVNFGSVRLPKEVFNRLLAIHDLVRRGISETAKEDQEASRKNEYRARMDAERDVLKVKSTLSLEEFFFQEKTGVAFVDLGRKPFKVHKRGERESLVWDVFCLVERQNDGQIRVAECPGRLKQFFAENGCGDWNRPDDDQYRGIPYPLGSVLRMALGKVVKAAGNNQPVNEAELAAETAETES